MASPTKCHKQKRPSLADAFDDLNIASPSQASSSSKKAPASNNLVQSIRKMMASTFRLGKGSVRVRSLRGIEVSFTIAMDEAYDYNLIDGDLDAHDIFPEIVSLGDELSAIFQAHFTSDQISAMDDYLLDFLGRMVFGSNMIEEAGAGLDVTMKLCRAIFRGEEVPDDIQERDPEYQELKMNLLRKNLPANVEAVLRSRREIIQHAKATSYIIHQVCICGKDLTEEIIMETHRLLTHKVDAENLPWTQYSGVYRTVDVRAGLHQFPDPLLVPGKMKAIIQELEQDLKQANDTGKIDPISLAAKYCHIFVNIHPFVDGNGRLCRLILNAILLKLGGSMVCIGEQGEDREEYMTICTTAGARLAFYEGSDEDEKPPKMYKEMASFTLVHARNSMRKLINAIKPKG